MGTGGIAKKATRCVEQIDRIIFALVLLGKSGIPQEQVLAMNQPELDKYVEKAMFLNGLLLNTPGQKQNSSPDQKPEETTTHYVVVRKPKK